MKKLFCRALTVVGTITILCALIGCSPQRKEARYKKRANQYFEEKQFEKAQIEYSNAARLNSTNTLAWTRLGLIAADRGDLTVAYRALTNVAKKLEPENLSVRSRLGKVYLSARMPIEARKEALFVLERDPLNAESMLVLASASRGEEVKDALQRLAKFPKEASRKPTFHLALAYLYIRENNGGAAETAYKRALEIDPRVTPALIGLGTLYWQQNRLKEADDAFRTAAELMPLRSNERLRWAQFKRGIGAAAEARSILEEMAAKFPDLSAPKLMLAEIALDERRFDDASSLVAKLLAKDSRQFEAMFLDAKIKIAQGKLSDGVKALERLAAQYPSVERLQYELAVAETASGDLAKADVAVKEALRTNPDFVDARLLQATLDLKRGNLAAAITAMERMTNQLPKLLNPYFLLAAGYVQRGSPQDALVVYRRLAAIAPTNAHVHFLSGLAYRQQRNNSAARAAFSRALEMNPNNILAAQNLIELDVIEKKFAPALERATRLAQKFPKSPEPLMLIARIHRAQGDIGKAEIVLRQLLEISSEYPPAFFELADIDFKASRFDAARDNFKKILEKNPRDVSALAKLGMLYEMKGELDKAAASYEQAVAVQPKLVVALNNLAYIYATQGKTNAYEHARQARNLAPSDPYVADTLGWVLYKRGDYAAALPLFQEAAEKQTTSAEVTFHLGTAYYMLGEEQAAQSALQRALELKTEFAGKQEVERELAVLRIDASKIGQRQLEALKTALEHNPTDPAILTRLATHYERTGAITQAIESNERVIRSNPKSLSALAALSRLYSYQAQDWATLEKAMDHAKQAREVAPDDPGVSASLGQLALKIKEYIVLAEKSGRQKDAERAAMRARDYWPKDADFASVLGRLRFDQRDYAAAIPHLRDVVRADKADAEIFYQLGMAHYQLKQFKESKTAFQKALELNLKGPRVDEAKRLWPELR